MEAGRDPPDAHDTRGVCAVCCGLYLKEEEEEEEEEDEKKKKRRVFHTHDPDCRFYALHELIRPLCYRVTLLLYYFSAGRLTHIISPGSKTNPPPTSSQFSSLEISKSQKSGHKTLYVYCRDAPH